MTWRSIKDDPPPRISRKEILMWDGERMFVAWWNSGTFWRIDHVPFDATHWMPLPEPPDA